MSNNFALALTTLRHIKPTSYPEQTKKRLGRRSFVTQPSVLFLSQLYGQCNGRQGLQVGAGSDDRDPPRVVLLTIHLLASTRGIKAHSTKLVSVGKQHIWQMSPSAIADVAAHYCLIMR
jgi:hypothetical protein